MYCIDTNGEYLVAGLRSGELLVFNNTNELKARFKAHNESVLCLKIFHNYIITGSKDKLIKVFSLENYQLKNVLSNHSSGVLSLATHDNIMLSCSVSFIKF